MSQDKLTKNIIRKWREQGMFIRFLDGNTMNCSITNLARVSLSDAMSHVHDWKVDWDMELTPSERALVMKPEWRAGLKMKD
jgi:hypothetical protein